MTLDEFIAKLQAIREQRNAGAWPVYAEGEGGAYEPTPAVDLLEDPVDAVCLIPDKQPDGSWFMHLFDLRK